MLDTKTSFRMSPQEQAGLDRDGFVVRERVFSPAECQTIVGDCEAMVADLLAAKRDTKHRVGSYMFEALKDIGTVVKWEPFAPDVIQGVEPFAHINKPLRDWGLDPRLLDPCKAIVGQDDIVLFTEKLNVKRARDGGAIVLHQDYPYWENMTPIAHRVAITITMDDTRTTRSRSAVGAAIDSRMRRIAQSAARRNAAAKISTTICPSSSPKLKPNSGSAMR